MKLFLVRHGESEGNVKGVVQGQRDYGLTLNGLSQARLLGKHLRNESFSAIYSSDLKRAAQTAKEITRYHDNELILTPALRERDFGSLSEKSSGDIDWENLPRDVESIKQIEERLFKFINSIEEDGNVLLVAHGGIIKGLIVYYSGKSFEEVGSISNASLSIVSDGVPELINYTGHLEESK